MEEINFQIEKLPVYALICILKTNSANEEYNSWDKADNPWIYGDTCHKKQVYLEINWPSEVLNSFLFLLSLLSWNHVKIYTTFLVWFALYVSKGT